MKYTILSPETEQRLAIVDHFETREDTVWEVAVFDPQGKEIKTVFKGALVSRTHHMLEVLFQGQRYVFPVTHQNTDGSFTMATALGSLRLLASRGVAPGTAAGGRAAHKVIKSSMPGKILRLLCKPGDQIEAGQPLLIIEAMKMENEIRASQAGVIEEIAVQLGQSIQSGELLIKIGKVAETSPVERPNE